MFMPPALSPSNEVSTVPAPIGGINARDSLVAMPETDAVVLRNWWPQPYGLTVRRGYRQWATGLSGAVQTLASWSSVAGSQKRFAWSTSNMYDITSSGAVGAAIVSGLSNAIWQTVSMVNSAGAHLLAVNGVDNAIIYNTSGVARISAGDGIVANTWAGIDPGDVVQLTIHQHRLWAVLKDSAAAWFLPPDAIQGTFVKYDFGPLFSKGGYISFMTTWTIDDGNGAEDHLVIMSSQGEVVVYGGTDPTDDTKWALVGVYYVGAPVSGRRAFTKASGDILFLTQQGVVSLTAQLVSTKVNEQEDPLTSKKIQFLISDIISSYSSLEGWEIKYYPKYNMLLINVPSATEGGNIQLAANQIIGSWTQFTGMDAATWGNFDISPYFGDYDGVVYEGWTGNKDNVLVDGTGGTSIEATAQQAYSYLQAGAVQKQVGFYRPTFVTSVPVSFNSKIIYDFESLNVSAPGLLSPVSGSLWGSGIWGLDVWGGGIYVQKEWISADGMGVAASLAMVTQTEGEVLWVSTDYSYIVGQGIF